MPRTIGSDAWRKRADQLEFVDRQLHLRRAEIDRMHADGEAHGKLLAAVEAGLEHALQVGGVGEVGGDLLASEQHQPAAADIALAGNRDRS